MSDFDKEAEREKLREQFAEDEEDRENTERMSELLLKGATMTNKHCDQCGDPIFRFRGQAFCPTCSAQAGAADVDDQLAAAADPDAAGRAGQGGQPEQAGQPDQASQGGQAGQPAQGEAGQQPPTQQPDATPHQPDDGADAPANGATADATDVDAPAVEDVERRVPDQPTARTPASTDAETSAPTSRTGDAAMADLGSARASLSRTVTRFAAAAEDADDLARAREYLAAVEDAAAALRAVRDAER